MASHRLLSAFRSKIPAFGAWITFSGTWAARTVALSSEHISWILIDCEHGLTPLQPGAAETIATVAGLGSQAPSAIVRIPATGICADGSAIWQIKYVLDAGARGVLVPMVETAAQARSIVSASRFPPQGTRGFGSPFTQASWGLSATDYLEQANDSVVVLGQIETREGVQNLQEILKVQGLDGVFIGPYDLSLSLGHPPPSPDPVPAIEETIQDILKSSHAAGKKCAIYCTSGEQAAKRAQEGFDMVCHGKHYAFTSAHGCVQRSMSPLIVVRWPKV
ncbi:unnamed protein product [Somion occarium]|uniref:HpcH/HpaI aldolase/citrate lyase domain-containing protein n=1 Tax=Somion occarium TaxID=3059160 RepID=A0ABP1DQH7_9APHY